MRLGQVRGTVVSTQKEPSLQGVKFLLVQWIDHEGNLESNYEVAADTVGAGVNEWVLVSRGSAARQVYSNPNIPVDALIVGIVDTVSLDTLRLYSKREQDR